MIVEERFELLWCKYDDLQKENYSLADIVIVHFDRAGIIKGTFLPIIKIKSKMGKFVPILAIINGTPQEIFSVLKAGAYDYIMTIRDTQEYKKKIESIALWVWYHKKYEFDKD